MVFIRTAFIIVLLINCYDLKAQTVNLIGASEEFILQNVKGYSSVESRGIEHEEFDVLVFEDKRRQLSFHFTFYKGGKVCSYIRNEGTAIFLKDEIDYIKANFKHIGAGVWENTARTVQVDIMNRPDQLVIMTKALR